MSPEQLLTLFNEGAAGRSPVTGDRAREAVASLRGYAYQAYAAALAWVELAPDAELHLEVAEDFAVAARNALQAVQVKDQAAPVTLASKEVRGALDAFVRLVANNPARTVRMTFLTTGAIGLERSNADRPGPGPGLLYWRGVADGADGTDVRALRRVLLGLKLTEATHEFIRGRDDERLRRDLIQSLDWQCGEAPLGDLAARFKERVAELCADELGIPLEEGPRVAPHLFLKVLETSASQEPRVLRHADLRTLANEATNLWVSRAAIGTLFKLLQGAPVAAAPSPGETRDTSDAEAELPLPGILAPRPALIADVTKALAEAPIVVLHGGTGVGKTLLARLAARQTTGAWRVLDLRGAALAEAGDQLLIYARRGRDGTRGLIADDVPDLDLADQRSAFVRAARMLIGRGELLVLGSEPNQARGQAVAKARTGSAPVLPAR